MSDPTVWFIQPPSRGGVDYSSANRYGKIQFLLAPEDSGSTAPTIVLRKLRKALTEKYNEGDYIAWAGGDPWNNFLAGMAIESVISVNSIPILIWDKERNIDDTVNKNGFYYPLTVNRRG